MKMNLTDQLKMMVGLGDTVDPEDLQAARESMLNDSPPPAAKPNIQFKTEPAVAAYRGEPSIGGRQVMTLGDPNMRSTGTASATGQESSAKRQPVKDYITNHPENDELKHDCWAAEAIYGDKYSELSPELFPEKEIRVLNRELHECENAAQREAINSKIARLSHPHAGPSIASARRELAKTYAIITRTRTALLENSLRIGRKYLDDAIVAETNFYADWGFAREATSISKRIQIVVNELAEMLRGMDLKNLEPHQALVQRDHVPSPWSGPTLSYFGIDRANSGDESAAGLCRVLQVEVDKIKAEIEQLKQETAESESTT